MIRADNFKRSLKDEEGIGTDAQGTMPFNTRFKEIEKLEKKEAEKNKQKKPPIGLKRRKLSFLKEEVPFLLLCILNVFVLFKSMATGRFSEMFTAIYLVFITLFFYNIYPFKYTKNINLLTWNVTTTFSALCKHICYGLYIRGRKIVIYFGIFLLISELMIPFMTSFLFLIMLIGSLFLFAQRETHDLFVLLRVFALCSIGIQILRVIMIGHLDPLGILICIVTYTLSGWFKEMMITEPQVTKEKM
ncbi:hypothetical protein [Bacillus sp. NPDC094106]|uniref:hypothetical protein n=1 Tax=Bacillus sp. NPDC094106 TaxID=3363949 RepID=UPI00382782E2